MSNIKILWLSHLIPYPPKGGVLMRSYFLSSGLAKHFKVDLAALIQPKLITPFFRSYEDGIKEARSHLGNIFNHVYFEEMNYRTPHASRMLAIKALFSSMPYSVSWHYSDSYQNIIKHLLANNHYDLIHVDTLGLYQFVSSISNVPLVLDHHNIESAMMFRRASKTKNFFKKIYFYLEALKLRQYEKKILDKFVHHITCSNEDLLLLHNINRHVRVTEIPNPVEKVESTSISRVDTAAPTALFVGGLDWYPNRDAIEHFLQSLAKPLFQAIPDLRFDIIGKNPSKEILERAKNFEQVKIHGFVDSIDTFYRNSTIFICPIRDGGGTKLKVIDAMMHKQVVIGYPEAFEGLAVTDGVHAIICKTPDEFIKKTLLYVKNTDALSKIRENAFKYVADTHSSDVVSEKISQLYLKLVSNNE